MKVDSSDQAVLQTLVYAKVFDAGIEADKLIRFIISPEPISNQKIYHSIERLKKRKFVEEYKGYLYLKSEKKLSPEMNKRMVISRLKIKKFQRQIIAISWIPSILAIGITGSVAADNALEDEDIDIFIVTKTGTLWATRLVVLSIAYCMRVLRRRKTVQVRDLWCLNLWLDSTSLCMGRQDLYTAREIVQTKWVLDKADVEKQMLARNKWLQKYLPNTIIDDTTQVELNSDNRGPTGILEKIAFSLQTKHMKKIKTRERVSEHFAFFHPKNTSADVQGNYNRRTKKIMMVYKSIKK